MAGLEQETDQLAEWVSQRWPIVDAHAPPLSQDPEEQSWLEQRSRALGLRPSSLERMVVEELRRLKADVEAGDGSSGEWEEAVRRNLGAPGSHAREALEILLGREIPSNAQGRGSQGRRRDCGEMSDGG